MTRANHETRGLRWPILQGVLPISGSRIPAEVIAGITLAALAVPEVMGYTKIAGMPVITGLYTILIPMALFAIFGSSRHLVVGADSATAAILAAGPICQPAQHITQPQTCRAGDEIGHHQTDQQDEGSANRPRLTHTKAPCGALVTGDVAHSACITKVPAGAIGNQSA